MAKDLKKPPIVKEPAKVTTDKPKNVKLVPPDGGWGWVVILAASINLVSVKRKLRFKLSK